MSSGAHDLNTNVLHCIGPAITAEEDITVDYGASEVGELPESMDSVMHHSTPKLRLRDSALKQFTTKSHTAGPEIPDGQSPLRHAHHVFRFPPHSSSTSRASSAKTSSSSLQALNEETVVGAHHSDPGCTTTTTTRTSLCQNLVQHPEPLTEPLLPATQPLHVSGDFPVYPDQSYAVLQSQVYPTPYPPPSLRSRNSYPLQTEFPSRDRPEPRTAGNTPTSSPGLFSARSSNQSTPPPASDDEARIGSPYLRPSHLQPPKETHTVELDRDLNTGNKLINDYEILEELGRGEHGKVKLGRHLHTKQRVAIKIVQRYSKRRRLGKLGNPEDKVKKEVAILKKARHPNVVSLLEVIDDPNRQKVYIVLEYVENGEIVWRKKGLKEVVHMDKRRIERERRGIPDSSSFMEEGQQYVRNAQFQRRRRERGRDKRLAHTQALQQQSIPAWSLEHGGESDDELRPELSLTRRLTSTHENSDAHSSPSRSYSPTSDLERRMRDQGLAAVEGSMYGSYVSDYSFDRRFSVTSSNFGYASSEPERLSDDDDMSYVPCLTIMEARNAFRDSVLGLEYLHYQGIIHRDIKPANLLVTAHHRVKISDFGVSYLGRPIRDDEEEQVAETDATELDDARELSKTVGTPAFYAPELCYTGDDFVKAIGRIPKISGAIDIWSLGVTLYGMIFGRLPFVSDDEFSMFQTIVKSEVFIPRKRLKPVEDDVPCLSSDQRYRVINSNKRTDDELVYEDIDDELRDLLKRLLTKDPAKRITIKEIKHHPWVLRGLPNPTVWIEESDPSYQSKGKKIEVSSEEVTSAVSKVPFIQRVRSNVAKLSGYIVGRREGRKRTPSTAALSDVSTATLQSNASVKDYREGRRASLRGDEEPIRSSRFTRDSEHPLSQSFLARPDSRDEDPVPLSDQDSNCDSVSLSGRTPRPRPLPPGRAVSTLSNAESTTTVRPSVASETTPSAPLRTTSVRESSGANVGGLFSGAGRRLPRSFRPGERRGFRTRSMDRSSVDGDGRSEPSLALSPASATGQVEFPNLWLEEGQPESPSHSHSTGRGHRRERSHQLTYQSSTESLKLREMLLRQAKREIEPVSNDAHFTSRMDTEPEAYFLEYQPSEQVRFDCSQMPTGLPTSPPSAVTISSSSADDYTSGMSQSASHPSIPSVMSGASSISGDVFHGHPPEQDKDVDMSAVPLILRTGDTVKASNLSQRLQDDEESIYYCDDEDDESEDEGLVFGKKRSAHVS